MKKKIQTIAVLLLAPIMLMAQNSKRNVLPEQLNKLMLTENMITRFYVDTVNEAKMVEAGIKAMLKELDDTRPALSQKETLSAEVQIKYEGYINRQMGEVSRHERLESRMLPSTLDYMSIKGLRIEAAQKLAAMRPATVGQASRISGVSPADISVLLITLGLH